MQRGFGLGIVSVTLLLPLGIGSIRAAGPDEKLVWKAGVAAVDVTPTESLWMAGYASRTKPSEGVTNPLYVKALSVEDERGTKFVLVTLDLIGIPRNMRDAIAKRVEAKYGLTSAALLLNASHTHSGPVVRSGGSVLYDLTPEQAQKVDAYNAGLQDKLIELIGAALADVQPARLSYCHARAGRREPALFTATSCRKHCAAQ